MGTRVLEPINYKFYDPQKLQKSKGRDKSDDKGKDKGNEKGNEKGNKKGRDKGKGKIHSSYLITELWLLSYHRAHSSYLILETIALI